MDSVRANWTSFALESDGFRLKLLTNPVLVLRGVGELREVSQRDRYIPKFEIMDK
jgi:hypothetical protein